MPNGQWRDRSAAPLWFRELLTRRAGRTLMTFLAAVAGLAMIVAVSGVRVASQQVGTVGVVRNGGPFDNRAIRQVLLPGQRLTWIGWYSQSPHVYPASNVTRTFQLGADATGGSDAAPTAPSEPSVPTKDGVQVQLAGTVYLRFIGERDIDELKAFDVGPGTKQYDGPAGPLYPWQGDDGFAGMMAALVGPVVQSDLRREVGQFQCAQLVASCAIVRQVVSNKPSRRTGSSIALIEERINQSLEPDLEKTLGHRYFWDLRLRITAVTLPKNVQDAVDGVQAQYAEVNSAKAEVLQARFLNARNRLLAKTYDRSPALSLIEALKAAPPKATVIINTGGEQPRILAGR